MNNNRSYIIVFILLVSIFSGCDKKKEVDSQAYWDIITHRTLGLAYLEENKLDEAEKEFLKLIELAPEEPLGHANLGLVYMRKGQLEEAEKRLNEAIDLAPKDPEIRLMRARAYELNNKLDLAIEDLEEAIDIDPEHTKSLYRLADIYANSNDPEASGLREKYLRDIVELEPTNIAPRMNLVEVELQNENYDEALKNLEEIASLYPELPKESVEYYEKAVAGLQNGKYEDARTATLIFHNYLKVTTNYQAGLQNLKGPGGTLIGFPVITFSQPVAEEIDENTSILEAIRFQDVSEDAGLGKLPSAINPHMALGDFDSDGDRDLYFGSSESHYLLRNDMGKFVNVTRQVGIDHEVKGVDATFVDFDNDGFLDLYIIAGDQHFLYHNKSEGEFVDITAEAGLIFRDPANSALFFDYDHEGDLDLFLARDGRNGIFQNNSDGTFQDITGEKAFLSEEKNSLDQAFGDFDEDGDIDLFVVNGNAGNSLFTNQRQGIFEDVTAGSGLDEERGFKAVTAGDYNNDGFLDLFLIGSSAGQFRLMQNQRDGTFIKDPELENSGILNGITGNDSEFLDFDNDGFLDLVVVGEASGQGKGVRLLHNDGSGKFEDVSDMLPPGLGTGTQVKVTDYNEDGDIDLFIADSREIHLIRNDGGNTNHHLRVQLVGLRTGSGKNNHFGIGAKVEMRSGDLYQMKVVTDPVVHFGMGQRTNADVVRILWTNGVPQNIFTPESDQELVEEQMLKGSCPFLYTWNGEEFVFVKDIMWRSALGMPLGIMAAETAYAFPDASKEFIKIPGDLLKPINGMYTLQLTTELWETVYIDEVKLIAVDHPESIDIFLDERFTPPPFPGMEIHQVEERILPFSATDGNGNDMLLSIAEKDNRYISNLKADKFQGFTELHDLILDPGDLEPEAPLKLFLNGWIFPSDASINVNVSQSETTKSIPPYLQVMNENGKWETAIENLGFPMGKDKTIIADLTGKFKTDDHRIRIRTNMQIYWDHIFFSKGTPKEQLNITWLNPESSDLHFRGYSRLYRKGGRYGPHWFDYSQVETGQKWRDLTGNYTRYGDVTELLDEADNMYIISNAGDEVTLNFDNTNLPELPDGWTRDFLIYSVGWVKDGDLNTAYGQTAEPLPFHEMSRYPYGEDESYPTTPEYKDYMSNYNTREVNTDKFRNALIEPHE